MVSLKKVSKLKKNQITFYKNNIRIMLEVTQIKDLNGHILNDIIQ